MTWVRTDPNHACILPQVNIQQPNPPAPAPGNAGPHPGSPTTGTPNWGGNWQAENTPGDGGKGIPFISVLPGARWRCDVCGAMYDLATVAEMAIWQREQQ